MEYMTFGLGLHGEVKRIMDVFEAFDLSYNEYYDDIYFYPIDFLYLLQFMYEKVNIYICRKNIWNKKFKEIRINIRNNC